MTTIKELIEHLETLPENNRVMVVENSYGFGKLVDSMYGSLKIGENTELTSNLFFLGKA